MSKKKPAIKLPRRWKIGYQTYDVHITESNLADLSYGHTSPSMGMITLNGRSSTTQSANTIVHEVLHAIWDGQALGKNPDEERIVTALANGLTQVMRDNPQLIDAIQSLLSERK